MVDAVHLERIGLQIDGNVTVHRIEIEKVVTDDFALVTQAQNKTVEPEMRVMLHDVNQDRLGADRNHRLRPKLGHFLEAGAEAATENEDRNMPDVRCHPST